MKSGTVAGSCAGRHGGGRGRRSPAGRASSASACRMRCWSCGQFGARVDAQFLGEQPAGVGVHGQRLRLPPAAVQRHHQQLAQPLPQRVGGGERGQFGDRLRVAAELQVQVEPGLE